MNDTLISIIIPANNAEKTLAKAVQSLGKDTRIEIIIIENGSSDNTLQKAESLSKTDHRITVLQSDKGVSNARNAGIKHATGRWLAFLDADDFMLPMGMNELLKNAEEEKADLYLYGHEAGKEKRPVSEEEYYYSGNNYNFGREEVIANPTKYMQVWAKLFNRDLVVSNNVKFNPLLRLSEDSDFTLHYLKIARSMLISSKIVYHYCLNAGSTMHHYDGGKVKAYAQAMQISSKAVEDESKEIQNAFQKYILMHLNILMVREVFSLDNSASLSKKLDQEKEICEIPVFQNAIRSVSLSDCRSVRLLPSYLLKKHFYRIASRLFMARVKQNTDKERNQGNV